MMGTLEEQEVEQAPANKLDTDGIHADPKTRLNT